ncbi:hypothetical protein GOBAR_AA34868 [Gossypium barbadense]|uniref:Uncharacterized protein n=1 Tax=Gossypium barbadense TaxID=3634 RepID=A0A2P5W3Y2_GOSBA|nr:hypothetical protein GOBAR_AA34868 [Gossypium barbadense]
MEEEKKKKRNKKKKNKQGKATEEDVDQIQNNNVSNGQSSGNALDLDTHQPNGALPSSAEEMIKELQKENELHVQKEALLEETINRLRNEFDSLLKKEASLEATIQQLQYERESHVQKVAGLGINIVGLQNEKEFWFQEKASLEEKISQLRDEKAGLHLKGATLEENVRQLEKEKESWIMTQLVIRLCGVINQSDICLTISLFSIVVELEESRNKLLQENQQLNENISSMQLHIQNLERNSTSNSQSEDVEKQASGNEDLKSQIEAANVFVDKLMMENAELVEKVNVLYAMLEQQSKAAEHSKVIETTNSVPRSLENGSILVPKLDSLVASPITNGKIEGENVDGQPAAPLPHNVESEDSGEIVQIPLDDTDVRDLESQATGTEENAVPLTDAPLIGAPFRLISFVARYVSGADLVNNT